MLVHSLIHLDELDALDVLLDFSDVLVPEAVWSEVAVHRPRVTAAPHPWPTAPVPPGLRASTPWPARSCSGPESCGALCSRPTAGLPAAVCPFMDRWVCWCARCALAAERRRRSSPCSRLAGMNHKMGARHAPVETGA